MALLFLGVACGPATAAEPARHAKPNIIFVLADDLGIDGVSCYGADKHQTPHIDALAASGLRFHDVLRGALVRAVALPADDRPLRLPHRRADQPVVARAAGRERSRPTNTPWPGS